MGTALEDFEDADGVIPRLIKCLFGYVNAASRVYDIELKVREVLAFLVLVIAAGYHHIIAPSECVCKDRHTHTQAKSSSSAST